jgi:hypothetical protein
MFIFEQRCYCTHILTKRWRASERAREKERALKFESSEKEERKLCFALHISLALTCSLRCFHFKEALFFIRQIEAGAKKI